jgi:glycine oxidase
MLQFYAQRACDYNNRMADHPDVLIIGGGVIGLTCAYSLARAGLRVEVLDKGDLGAEASWAGAGIIPPGNPEKARTPYDRLRALSASLYPSISAELAELTGIQNGYRVCGGVEFLPTGDDGIIRAWQSEGIAFERLTAGALRDLEPAVGVVPGIPFHLPGMAQVRNPRHLKALIGACLRLGVKLRPRTQALDWELNGERVLSVRLHDGTRREAGQFLIAAGAWADQLLDPLECFAQIRPVRGQIVLLRCPAPPFHNILLRGKNYLVPRDDGRVLVGSTEEPEAGFVKQTTADAVAGLIHFAIETVPALSDAEVERAWAGLRPGSADGMPYLGPVPAYRNVFLAAGHFRAGIQLSTGTALVMTECLTGKRLSIPLEAFRPDREPAFDYSPAFRS